MPRTARQRQSTGHPGGIALVALLAVLVVAVVIVSNTVFIVRKITVEGNRYCSADEVIASSGIQIGTSIFSLDTGAVKAGINSNRYLQYVGIWRDFPDHVILTVTENSPWATLTWAGMLIILGNDGIVLEKTSHIDITLQVPVITGMLVESDRVGQPIVFSAAGQFDAVQNVLSELDRQNVIQEMSELNVTDLDNLYLVTEDGLQVMLGSDDALEAKITLMRAALAYLRESKAEQVRGGVLVVTTGEVADFRPPVGG